MLWEIKNKIDLELKKYLAEIDKIYSLSSLSPVIYNNIKEFALREGKRIRPCLFIIGYKAFSGKTPSGLYRSAVSLELLHDFMLIHDDIIDKSDTRRGKPSMHIMLNRNLKGRKNIKFDGKDLAIAIGDIIYAFSIHSFLAVKESPLRKETALKKLIEAAIYTGSGEFIELLSGIKDMDKINKADIYKIYDFKTANYTFASPLCVGAILAGAKSKQYKKLFEYGTYLGRAFQIKDDIIGLFGKESDIGKPNLTDIKEAKKTILIWYAYNKSDAKDRKTIQRIFRNKNSGQRELSEIRKIVTKSNALEYAKNEILSCRNKASNTLRGLVLRKKYKDFLESYSRKVLSL